MVADRVPFLSLDFLYVPSRHPDREIAYYTDMLGGILQFRVKAMGTEVSAVKLSEQGPLVLLAEHLKGETPILIYRVDKFHEAIQALEQRGWKQGTMLEIPHGPCCTFVAEGGQRLAIYELTRPEAATHFLGRFDK
jgi:hypothetical protein